MKEPTKEEFLEKVKELNEDTKFQSNPIYSDGHPAHLRICAMSKVALPWILESLRDEPNWWFSALRAITGEDPVTEEQWGRLDKCRDAWLEWGFKNGINLNQ